MTTIQKANNMLRIFLMETPDGPDFKTPDLINFNKINIFYMSD